MTDIVHSLTFVSAGAAGALISAVWEGAVLALGVYLCMRLFPALSAAARSIVWLNVFVLILLLHFVPMIAGPMADPENASASTVHLGLRWSVGIAAVWMALSLWRAAQLIHGVVHLRRLAGRAVPVDVDTELKSLLADAPGNRAATLCASEEVLRPSVIGFFQPRILVPPVLIGALTPQELQQVVLHEMEHLRRGDDWTNLLQKIGLVLFPLNPVLIWVERRLCAERELACDDHVIHSRGGRKAYALCLTRLAELSLFRRSYSLVLGLWERRPELVRRVQRLIGQPSRTMGRRPAIAATGTVLAGALACAVALSHSPQLVSFLPAHQPVLQARSLDPHEVARALGGTPQLIKATMPAPEPGSDSQFNQPQKPVHRAVLKNARRPKPARSQIASLDFAPSPLPRIEHRELVVLTEITGFQPPPRVVLAVSPDGHSMRPARVQATYAIVPTPAGWLIIQI